MAEEMLKARQQILVVDPTGAWSGLQSSADGKAPGFPVVIFGGERANVPLNETAGEVVAQAVVDHRFSAVLDLSLLRKGQTRRFLTPFLETLYRLNREPLHLFVDEADDVCPQKPFGDEAQMVGAMEDVVKRGRKKGIGCTLITQRPADLAKQVLTQCEVLVAMRLLHPRDIGAVKEWVNMHADPAEAKELIDSLPSLPIGTAWFWSPGWLGVLQRVAVRHRETFDSSATPKVGEAPRQPKKLAEIDVRALGQQKVAGGLKTAIGRAASPAPAPRTTVTPSASRPTPAARVAPVPRPAAPPAASDGETTGPEQRILDALAWMGSIGVPEPEQAAVAFLAGYTIGGGAWNNPRGRLRTRGLIEYRSGDRLALTDAGRAIARAPDSPLTTEELHRRVLERLPGPEQKLLRVLLAAYPDPVSNEDLARQAGYEPGGGAFNNPRGRLRTLGLLDYPSKGQVAAVPLLFLA